MVLKKAIFLDKDGTLIPNTPYSIDPDQVQLSLDVVKALRVFSKLDYQLFIITNQSGVARGYFNEKQVRLVARRFREAFQSMGIHLQGFHYCPHHPEGNAPYNIDCECRKPKPGMILQAAKMHSINLEKSWFIGDILHDIEAGRRAGCRTILLDNGGETEWELSGDRLPHHIVSNLLDAAKVVTALHYYDRILEQHESNPLGTTE
jgi:D,D-heptose 1,7-bisphosphate phosphatase